MASSGRSLRLGITDIRRLNPQWPDQMVLDYLGREEDSDALDDRVSTNETNIAINVENIAINADGIATNAADIATNATNIATNSANIATNAANIATNAANIAINADTLVAKGAASRFRGTNTVDSFFNSTLQRPGTGIYELNLDQETVDGVDIALEGFISVAYQFDTAGLFQVEAVGLTTGFIRVFITEVTISGGAFVFTPVDLGNNDRVNVVCNILTGNLPPP